MGDYAEYAILGYAMMGIILAWMVVWLYLRYVRLAREERAIAQIEEEERQDRVRQTVGALEHDAQPEASTRGQSGMASPSSEHAQTISSER